jgi:hypothetical protein
VGVGDVGETDARSAPCHGADRGRSASATVQSDDARARTARFQDEIDLRALIESVVSFRREPRGQRWSGIACWRSALDPPRVRPALDASPGPVLVVDCEGAA